MKLKRFFFILLAAATIGMQSCGDTGASNEALNGQDNETAANGDNGSSTTVRVKNILFFGNSLTAGYGLEPDQAFPALIQQRIDSLSLPFKVINAGVSGETTAGGKSRIDWLLKQPVDVFVLELGANDGLRGINLDETYKNLQIIIQKVREKNPEVEIILAGMQIPPNMGQKYATQFREIYTRLAEEENVGLIPFLLEGVAGNPELNQGDGIHPTVEGQKIVANNVWEVLEEVIAAPSEA